MTPDPIRRGWRPPRLNDRQRAGLLLLAGLALVLSPFWLGPAIAAVFPPSETFEYEAVPIEPAGDRLHAERGRYGFYRHGISGVACLVDDDDSACFYAYGARNETWTRPEYQPVPEEFVHLDRFYRPTAVGEAEVRLEPVTAEQVIADISRPPANLSASARRVVEAGPVTTHDRIMGEGQVVDTADGYRVVTLVDRTTPRGGIPLPPLVLIEIHAVAIGLGLLRVGQRNYDRWRGRQPA